MSRLTSAFLQVIAAMAVMIAHGTAYDERLFHETADVFSLSFVGVLLNQLTRFTVPVFLMISGYGLCTAHNSCAGLRLGGFAFGSFYGKRLHRAFFPFAVASVLFLLPPLWALYGEGWRLIVEEGVLRFFQALVLGDARYHLYFMPIILQAYLLFPFLARLSAVGGGRAGHALFVLLFLAHLFWMYPVVDGLMALGVPVVLPHSSLFVYWVLYFYTGMYFRVHQQPIRNYLYGHRALFGFALVGSFAWMMMEYLYRLPHNPSPGMYNHFNRVPVVFFAMGVFFLFVLLDERIQRSSRAERVGAALGPLVFFVYLYHPVVLDLLNHTVLAPYTIALSAVLVGIMFGVGLLLHRYLPHGFLLRDALGLARRKPVHPARQ